MGKMNIWFDEEGDFLEITTVPSKRDSLKTLETTSGSEWTAKATS